MAVLIATTLSTAAASAVERVVSGGINQGRTRPDGSMLFRGISYARPPWATYDGNRRCRTIR